MTTILVESLPQIQLTDAPVQQSTKHCPLTFTLNAPSVETSESVVQLAHLASQHHTSEYNRLKFGVHGCSVKYFPLSVYLPEHFRELQLRQARYSQAQSWWHCHQPEAPKEPSVVVLGPCGVHTQETIDLQDQILAAMAAPLDNKPPPMEEARLLHPPVKTSSTHPINISSIISSELIPLISSHLLLTSSSSSQSPATMFEIPRSFTLDRLVLSPTRYNLPQHCIPSQSSSPPTPVSKSKSVLGRLQTRSGVSEALQAAINSGLSAVNANANINNITRDAALKTGRLASDNASPLNRPRPRLHSNTSSVSLSLSLAMATTSTPSPMIYKPILLGAADRSNASPISLHIEEHNTPRKQEDKGLPITSPSNSLNSSPPSLSNPFLIGNLFLSSCPGKKVRLLGPTKGRSGVCRDLDTDMKRMKDLGIRCIVCCLDDEELKFLGVPWPEYKKCAKNMGLDILRIPTPEGLAPLTPTSLNTQLTELINRYTLCGIPVLVHCRGGVGRAGVIACCWLIKLGLCGWVEIDNGSGASTSSLTLTPQDGNDPGTKHLTGLDATPITNAVTGQGFSGDASRGVLRGDTVQFVERIITVVRKRRSLKAIETYEQVRFLVDFVEHLREGIADVEP